MIYPQDDAGDLAGDLRVAMAARSSRGVMKPGVFYIVTVPGTSRLWTLNGDGRR